MKRESYINYLKNPDRLNEDSIAGLTELLTDFPYCQTTRTLLVLNLYKEKHFRYEAELEKTAIYVANRKVLKNNIDKLDKKPPIQPTQIDDGIGTPESDQKETLVAVQQETDIPVEKENLAEAPTPSKKDETPSDFREKVELTSGTVIELPDVKTDHEHEEPEETTLEVDEITTEVELAEDSKDQVPEEKVVGNSTLDIPETEDLPLDLAAEEVERTVESADQTPDAKADEPAVVPREEAKEIEQPRDWSKKETKEDVLSHLKKIIAERLKTIDNEKRKEETEPEKPIESDEPVRSKKDIIEEFIKKQPRISRPQVTFFNPVDAANKSVVDEENIVSETLAKIYFDQGQFSKAMNIYNKLCLKFPEKSSYFAALIKKAEKEIKK